jgi:hypothetical protein
VGSGMTLHDFCRLHCTKCANGDGYDVNIRGGGLWLSEELVLDWGSRDLSYDEVIDIVKRMLHQRHHAHRRLK